MVKIKTRMKELKSKKTKEWSAEIRDHKNVIFLSFLFLAVAMYLNYLAGSYVDRAAKVVAPDLILSNLPLVNLSVFYVYGFFIVILALFIHPLFFHVNEFHKVISQFSLLVLIRSFFVTLTHLQVPPEAIMIPSTSWNSLIAFQNDMFFSGHTAVPFLGFLIYRNHKLRNFFLIATIVMASTVLLMHAHYSIDVFAALFITYTSFEIGNQFFGKIKG